MNWLFGGGGGTQQKEVNSNAVQLPEAVHVPSASSASITATTSSESLTDRVYKTLSDNPYFNAGAGLAGIGLAMGVAKRLAIVGTAYFRRRHMISFQVNNEDPSYPWILDFINRKSLSASRHLSVNTTLTQAESGRTHLAVTYLPGHGDHIFLYKWRWIKVERQREKQVIQREGVRRALETVTLTTLGSDPKFFMDMVDAASREAIQQAETGLVVYQAVGPQWLRFGMPRRKRAIESVVLDDHIAEDIVRDFREFVESSKWYLDRGVPYRRGYLFFGPPGTGKSSFISALASHFGYSVCLLSLSERTLDDDRLNHLLNTAPPNSVIILEDIDAAFASREDPMDKHPAYQGMTRVTFSGLLNAIDGVASAEERILFMTTNHVDRLDPALVRPGRVDYKQFFGNATYNMLKKMFIRFYASDNTDTLEVEAEEFARRASTGGKELSPAQVQGHFLLHKHDPSTAIRTASSIKQ